MKHSCLLSGKHKFAANLRDKDHKITKTHHFVALHKHLNVAFIIQMLQHSKVCLNVEHSFMH